MTIEIKQLIIRAVVEETRPRPAAPAGRAAPEPVRPAASSRPGEPDVDRDALIAECTRHVLRELRKERGR